MRAKKYLVWHRHVPWVIWRDAGHLKDPNVILDVWSRGLLAPLRSFHSSRLQEFQFQLRNHSPLVLTAFKIRRMKAKAV